MPYKGGVQLLPETQRRPTLRSYTSGNSYFYAAVFIGALILVASATLGGYKASLVKDIEAIDGQLSQGENARNKDQEKELIAASRQSKLIRQLIGSKLYWTQALQKFEQMLQSSVTLNSLEGDVQAGAISFRATADNYAAVARQIAAFVSATGVNDISLGAIETESGGRVTFSGDLTIDTKAMLMKAQPTPSKTPTP